MSEAGDTWPEMPAFVPDDEESVSQPSMLDAIVDAAMVTPEPTPAPAEPPPTRKKGGVEQSFCEVCNKWYSKKWLYSHRRKAHGIYGGKSGRGRKLGSKNRPKPKMEIDQVVDGHKAQKLPPLTAEQITRAAAEALWPKGIPHDHLTALLRWNIQTHYFLAEVSQ